MKEPKVAVIVPTFNTERYLRPCLDSLVRQDYANAVFFAVDDGSTDKSGAILDEYARIELRLRVIHQENRGISEALNTGLAAVEKEGGFEFIGFCDSDDTVHPSMISEMVSSLLESSADLAVCAFREMFRNHTSEGRSVALPSPPVITATDFIDLIYGVGKWHLTKVSGGMVWKSLFRANLVKGEHFDSTLSRLADELFSLNIAKKMESAVVVPKVLYNYRIRKSSSRKLPPGKDIAARRKILEVARSISRKTYLAAGAALAGSVLTAYKNEPQRYRKELLELEDLVNEAASTGAMSSYVAYKYKMHCHKPLWSAAYLRLKKLRDSIRHRRPENYFE